MSGDADFLEGQRAGGSRSTGGLSLSLALLGLPPWGKLRLATKGAQAVDRLSWLVLIWRELGNPP